MTILVVEDSAARIKFFRTHFGEHALYVTKDPNEAIQWLQDPKTEFDLIFLDHDLGHEEQPPTDVNGKPIARWLADHPEKHPNAITYVHSINYPGGLAMLNMMVPFRPWCAWVPFGQLVRLLTR